MRGGTDKSRYDKCKCISNEHILCKIMAVSLRPRDNLIRDKRGRKGDEDLFIWWLII